ncbi:ankyrin repeat-containing domain protein [Schizothecium vesticola]|uniref:Ankyrin repeat-containing domain protein n=1 Tax=Schizothecium vesticola TaxID=314040 RepID=A0AA40EWY5_9PEZI|nr:ankyrin repeat-containing domain protein [Schizothecium vesticola]
MACFARLPVELLVLVIENLDAVADLASLAQTDRKLYGLAIPVLYQRAALQPNPKPLSWAAQYGIVPTLERALAAGIDPNHAFVDHVPLKTWHQANTLAKLGAVSDKDAAWDTESDHSSSSRQSELGHSLDDDSSSVAVSDMDMYEDGGHNAVAGRLGERSHIDDPLCPLPRVRRGYRAIHLAAQAGHHVVVEMLLDHGADIDAPASWLCDCPRLYGLLNAAESPEAQNAPPKWTPLHLAICRSHPEMAKLLLSRGASHVVQVLGGPGDEDPGAAQGVTALHDAARMGLAGVVQYLVQEGIQTDVDVRDTKTLTPLYHAYEGRRWDSTVPLLLQLGADINVDVKLFMPYTAITPMGEACRLGHFAAADRLLDLGAGAMRGFTVTTTGAGLSPLHMCCMPSARPGSALPPNSRRIYEEEDRGLARMHTIQKLIEKGASVSATDCSGNTPLLTAAENHNAPALQVLLGAGVSPRDRDCMGRNAMMRAIMGPPQDSLLGESDRISEPLAQTLRILVHGGVPLDETDTEGNTLLHLIFKGHLSFKQSQVKAALRHLLSMHGAADLARIRNKEGHTPLYLAFERHNLDACDVLVRKGYLRGGLDRSELEAMFALAVNACRFQSMFTEPIHFVLDLDVHGILTTNPTVLQDLLGLPDCDAGIVAARIIVDRGLPPMSPVEATCLLGWAISDDRLPFAYALLNMGADVNGRHRDNDDYPLAALVRRQRHRAGVALPPAEIQFAQALLERGANPHLRVCPTKPERILNTIINNRINDVLLMILKKHSLASDPRAVGGAYLHSALSIVRDDYYQPCPSEEVIDALLASGADPCEMDERGDTPLSVLLQSFCNEPRYAWRYRRFVKALAVPGVDVNRRNNDGKSIIDYLQQLMDADSVASKGTAFFARRIQIVDGGDGTKSLCFLPRPEARTKLRT